MAGQIASRQNARQEFEELMRIMTRLRCEVGRANDGRLYSDVNFRLDRICADIQRAGMGKDPWKTVQDAKRKIGDIQKEVLVNTSQNRSYHGDEAGTLKEVVQRASPPPRR